MSMLPPHSDPADSSYRVSSKNPETAPPALAASLVMEARRALARATASVLAGGMERLAGLVEMIDGLPASPAAPATIPIEPTPIFTMSIRTLEKGHRMTAIVRRFPGDDASVCRRCAGRCFAHRGTCLIVVHAHIPKEDATDYQVPPDAEWEGSIEPASRVQRRVIPSEGGES